MKYEDHDLKLLESTTGAFPLPASPVRRGR
jgi:hypothetical protein